MEVKTFRVKKTWEEKPRKCKLYTEKHEDILSFYTFSRNKHSRHPVSSRNAIAVSCIHYVIVGNGVNSHHSTYDSATATIAEDSRCANCACTCLVCCTLRLCANNI